MAFFEEVTAGLDLTKAYFTPTVIFDENRLSGAKKKRKIYPQSETMVHLQNHLKTWLRKQKFRLSSAVGAVPGGSPFVNVKRHRRKAENGDYFFPRYFYLVDLKDAYKKVKIPLLAKIISACDIELFNKEEELEEFFTKYCSSDEGGIATGAGASPDLFNIYCAVLLDAYFQKYCPAFRITYTRYLDDLTFSCNMPFGRKKRKLLRNIIRNAGFQISEHKTRKYDLKKGSVVINGISIDIHGNIFVPRWFTSELRGMLYKVLNKKGDQIPEVTVRGKVNIFLQALRAKGRKPNMTELKVEKLCRSYLIQQQEIRKALQKKG